MDCLQMFLLICKFLICHSNGKCILIVVLIDTHILLLWTFIISAPTEKRNKKIRKFKFWKIVSPIAIEYCHGKYGMCCLLIPAQHLFIWYSNTLYCNIFSKFVKLYEQKMYILSKNSHPSLLVLSHILFPCVYKVF